FLFVMSVLPCSRKRPGGPRITYLYCTWNGPWCQLESVASAGFPSGGIGVPHLGVQALYLIPCGAARTEGRGGPGGHAPAERPRQGAVELPAVEEPGHQGVPRPYGGDRVPPHPVAEEAPAPLLQEHGALGPHGDHHVPGPLLLEQLPVLLGLLHRGD